LTLYPPLPPEAFFHADGLTRVRQPVWDAYLAGLLPRAFPGARLGSAAAQQNPCILTSLQAYLRAEFGMLLPEPNLFPLFNADGEGVAAGQITAAVSALVEPLGLEIEAILAPDPELRDALGSRACGLERAAAFEGRGGLAAIHITGGYCHAFFWPIMDARKFSDARFRLALTLRQQGPIPSQEVSSIDKASTSSL
jgi:hypothetical protein